MRGATKADGTPFQPLAFSPRCMDSEAEYYPVDLRAGWPIALASHDFVRCGDFGQIEIRDLFCRGD